MGMGLAVTNALSAILTLEVRRDGRTFRQTYVCGKPTGPLEDVGSALGSGTRITFTRDRGIFGARVYDRDAIRERLRELAFLNPELTLILDHEAFRFPRGSADYLDWVCREVPRLHASPILCRGCCEGVEVDVALQWTDCMAYQVRGFVGQSPTTKGTHLEGLRAGLVSAVLDDVPEFAERGVAHSAVAEIVELGLHAFVDVRLEDPRFGAPTKEWLTNPEAGHAVETIVARELRAALRVTPELRDRLLRRVPRSLM
jgi:DNA gyrase subunit B